MFLDLSRPFTIHLKLHNLQKVRDGLLYPYDPILMHALVLTMNDLVQSFGARLAHVSLYELIVWFDFSVLNMSSSKLMTTYASFATVRFNHHLVNNLYTEQYLQAYTQDKLNTLMDKQQMFYADYYQPLPEHITAMRDNTVMQLLAHTHQILTEYIHKIYPTVKTDEHDVQTLLQWVHCVVRLPDFAVYGVFAKRDTLGKIVNRAVPIVEPEVFRVLHEISWSAMDALGTVVEKSMLYSVQVLKKKNVTVGTTGVTTETVKTTNTEVSELGSALVVDLDIGNNTASPVSTNPLVLNSDRCSK